MIVGLAFVLLVTLLFTGGIFLFLVVPQFLWNKHKDKTKKSPFETLQIDESASNDEVHLAFVTRMKEMVRLDADESVIIRQAAHYSKQKIQAAYAAVKKIRGL